MKKDVLQLIKKGGRPTKTATIANRFGVSRQYANLIISRLVSEGKLVKIGSTRNAQYVTSEYAVKHPEFFPEKFINVFQNKNLEEHKVFDEIEKQFLPISKLNENLRSILFYAFSEMFNNAIEHSKSKKISVTMSVTNKQLMFVVDDFGIGVFRSIKNKKKLKSELEAIQDLLKGKTTTMPRSHSGEGIFFTSKVSDKFTLDSYGYKLIVDNVIKDIFLQKIKGKGRQKEGTKVTFEISAKSKKRLNDVFRRYANIDKEGNYGFDKTEIKVKLYTEGGVYISRSQARRVLSGLDKFRIIVFDFDKVSVVGQAFADEIFRVFHNKNPKIKLQAVNMNEAVRFMVERAGGVKPKG